MRTREAVTVFMCDTLNRPAAVAGVLETDDDLIRGIPEGMSHGFMSWSSRTPLT